MRRDAAYTLNKQSRTADKLSSGFGVGRGLSTLNCKEPGEPWSRCKITLCLTLRKERRLRALEYTA